MGQASIPVDLFNPGQVFACMGFLEAAEMLLGEAEGGFDWTHKPRFRLRAKGDKNPFYVVLEFLSNAQLLCVIPNGYTDPVSSKTKKRKTQDANAERNHRQEDGPVCMVETFPASTANDKTLPLRLHWSGCHLDITHLCDESSRNVFKLFAGTQTSRKIAQEMLDAIKRLWEHSPKPLMDDPLGLTMPLGGSTFKLDARKAWTALDAGYSPDDQKHAVEASPVVEMLAAVGLEHARPDVCDGVREVVRYGVWKDPLPPMLARPVLGGASLGFPMRIFRFTLKDAGWNKVVTFAEEETNL